MPHMSGNSYSDATSTQKEKAALRGTIVGTGGHRETSHRSVWAALLQVFGRLWNWRYKFGCKFDVSSM
jgi:hypothetical protein